MKYRLRDFQKDAADSLLMKIDSMRSSYDKDGSLSAVSLTAPTGAGKTVISAAVIEGLFYGNDVYAGDDRATVLWLTDSQNLNAQTMKRFESATEQLSNTVMESIDNTFSKSHSKLLPGRIYFLNRQLLGKGRKLQGEAEGGRSFYDILNNTIEDPDIHLYLFIDEAHRGLGTSGSYKGTSDSQNKTIYSIIIDGQDGINRPMPCVIGISATPERFNLAMKGRKDRDIKAPVAVPIEAVRASGLIKDTIELRTPKSSADTKHQDLAQACAKLADSFRLWSRYCDSKGLPRITPLMVVQVEDKIADETLGRLCQQIHRILPWLDITECFANVFGGDKHDHKDIVTEFAKIPYIRPEDVSEHTEIKVLFAKDAVSTGWDCPRAEVIYSRSKRSDPTYIAQLIGRMIRTPLTRRIADMEELNTVACYLPEYDSKTVESVIAKLKEDSSIAADGGAEVIINAAEVRFYNYAKQKAESQLKRIDDISFGTAEEPSAEYSVASQEFYANTDWGSEDSSEVAFSDITAEKLKEITERVPKADGQAIKYSFEGIVSRQVRHDKADVFLDLWECIDVISNEIESDKIESDEIEPNTCLAQSIKEEFYNNVEGEIIKHPAEFRRSFSNIRNTTVTVKRIDPLTGDVYENREELVTNDSDRMAMYYKSAVKRFSGAPDLVTHYINRRTSSEGDDNASAVGRIAAVAHCFEIVQALEVWAERRIRQLLDDYGPQRYMIADDANIETWDRIEGNTKPYIERNLSISAAQTRQNTDYDKYEKHIVCDMDGWAYIKLDSDLEKKVVRTELSRPGCVAWYRNPRASHCSLAIAYEINGQYESMYPDFIFFQQRKDGSIVRSIVDPHGDWLGDSVAKLKGYVAYLKDHPKMFDAVLAVTGEKDRELRYLNLLKSDTQKAIEEFNGSSAKELFTGKHSQVYNVKSE